MMCKNLLFEVFCLILLPVMLYKLYRSKICGEQILWTGQGTSTFQHVFKQN